jgi:hypothetical protein
MPDAPDQDEAAAGRISTSLNSSWLTAMDWDPDTLELTLTMRGDTFTHYNVPESVAKGLQTAPSAGQYWHNVIKDAY